MIDKNYILLFVLILLSKAHKAEITEEEIKETDIFDLISHPEATESTLTKKMYFDLAELFNVENMPSSFEDAYMMYTSAGSLSNEYHVNLDEKIQHYADKIADEEKDFINNYTCAKLNEMAVIDENDLATRIASFEKLYLQKELHIVRKAIFDKVENFEHVNDFAEILKRIFAATKKTVEEEQKSQSGQSCVTNFNSLIKLLKEKFNVVVSRLAAKNYHQYIYNVNNFEILYLNSLVKLANEFKASSNTNQTELKSFALKTFSLYSVITRKIRYIDAKEYSSLLRKIFKVLGFEHSAERAEIFSMIFNMEKSIEYSEPHFAFINNMYYAVYSDYNIDVQVGNIKLYANEFVFYKLNYKMIEKAISLAFIWISDINNEDFKNYVVSKLFEFFLANPDADVSLFSYYFDQYLDRNSNANPIYFNILKFLNALNGATLNIEWSVVKLLKINDIEQLEEFLDSCSEQFISDLNIVKDNSGIESEDEDEVYTVLLQNEFLMKWFGKVTTQTTEYHTKVDADNLKVRDLDYQYKLHAFNAEELLKRQQQDNGLDQPSKKRYNQRKGPDSDDLNNDIDENVEDNQPIDVLSRRSSNKIKEFEDRPENIIHEIIGPLSEMAKDQLLEINLRERLNEPDYKVDGFDKVLVLEVIPSDSDCLEMIRRELAKQKN